jgi:hypothetical protein
LRDVTASRVYGRGMMSHSRRTKRFVDGIAEIVA